MAHEHIRELRDDSLEQLHHDKPFAEVRSLTGYLPPCQRDANAFGSDGFIIKHDDPLPGRNLPSVEEELPPYSSCPTPYRWMLEGNFRDICEDENLQIRGRRNPDSASTWVMEDDRQRALLKHFWGKLVEGSSLVFYYCNRGNAVDDTLNRLLVGVSRIVDIGEPKYFGTRKDRPGNFPVWSRRVTNGLPSQGVRIPYQEYIALGKNTEGIVCRPPNGLMLPFSYVAEHVSDGQAVSAILAILKSIEQVRADGFVSGAWEEVVSWCNSILDEVWSGRGAYPGLGSVLRYLGFSRAHAYQATKLREIERSGKDPWKFVLSILQGREEPPIDHYREGLLAAAGQWRLIPSRHSLLETLTHFELTTDQVTGVANEDLREKRGIFASPANIVNNAYSLFEQDRGSQNSEPIALETIDQGMWPEGDAALFRSDGRIAHNDRRRVRATAYGVLRDAANKDGHTLLPFEAFIKAVHNYFPDRRRCLLDREAFLEGEDRKFYEMILWLKDEPYPETWRTSVWGEEPSAEIDDELAEDLGREAEDSNPTITLVALKSVRRQEVEIAKVISENVRAIGVTELPNWRDLLTQDADKGGFGEPQTPRENDAIEEKVRALEVLYSQRVSILTGGAGTGKTSVLRVFLEQLRAIEGFTATLLAAPTGKARVRLEAATKRSANTIHQVLHRAEMLVENYRILDQKPERGRIIYRNLVIDESSMPSVELLAALFRAVDTNAFHRLIFVGDPFQLPPIGPGRPFVDILQWMREQHPECIAELKTCMRVAPTTSGVVFSRGLELATCYRDEAGPGDDAILSELVKAGELADVRISFWNDHADLLNKIDSALESQFGIVGDDVAAFDRSLGIDTEEWRLCENWQILSPTRIQPFGTDELNRVIQGRFRSEMLSVARDPLSAWPAPMGDQEIVFHDKVMQRQNQAKWLPKGATGLQFVANGEIGVIVKAWKGKNEKPDNVRVVFSTQPEAEYRYYKMDAQEVLELAYALTVHKAQGSDFDLVIFIIPRKEQTLSRELLYTGLTRFKGKLILLVEKDSKPLLEFRKPEASNTMRRTTRMFKLLIGHDAGEIGIKKPYRPEGLIHRTTDGTGVRSKSEVIVYDVLDALGLSVQYEEPLFGKSGDPRDFRLPDFTVHERGRTWYWEHLGMLETAKYRDDWADKIRWYQANGYWDKVITSEDHAGGIGGIVYADEVREIAQKHIMLP
jgi:hypothetical protein